MWRAKLRVLEVEAAHDPGLAVILGQSESLGDLVPHRVLVGDHRSSPSMAPLVVMVVHKHERVFRLNHAPARVIDAPDCPQEFAGLLDLGAESELGHLPQVLVHMHADLKVWVGQGGRGVMLKKSTIEIIQY